MKFLQELAAVLRVKTCDLRADVLEQCRHAIDRGIHIGGAYSAIPILTALYYGGQMRRDITNPASSDQDIFILSKGHAVAALAAVLADIGYFSRDHLKGSRGWNALIKGHPGPVIPGVPVSTGPLGQGIAVACGFALWGVQRNGRDVYCLTGDGELQEGSCWEALMFAGARRLNNLCVLIDRNGGQSDDTGKLVLSVEPLEDKLRAFGFEVTTVDGSDPGAVVAALEPFKRYPRSMHPAAIICDTIKGEGGFSGLTGAHKAVFSDDALDVETAQLFHLRTQWIKCAALYDASIIGTVAGRLGYDCAWDSSGKLTGVTRRDCPPKARRAARRDPALCYDVDALPRLSHDKLYIAGDMLHQIAKAFAVDSRFYTIDADLSNASRLFSGTASVNRTHAVNVGIAELTMMCMAEGLAAEGANVWASTFPPFFNLQALRRIAVSYQERSEAIDHPDGWLSPGHNLDITFVGTNANLDTAVNGATHMANDDMHIFGAIAHLKIIDISCPQLLLSVARWIAQGGRGLVYLRTMRDPASVLYEENFVFEYGKGYILKQGEDAIIVSSGRGVHEALKSARLLSEEGIDVAVIDMPSFDGALLAELSRNRPLLFAEQNNGYLYKEFAWHALRKGVHCDRVRGINTLKDGAAQFVHSGSYEQLIEHFGLDAASVTRCIRMMLEVGE